MRLVLISDTHGARPDLPDGDVLVHAGDLTMTGRRDEVVSSLGWLETQNTRFDDVVMIPGNHDFLFEHRPDACAYMCDQMDITLLNDSGTEIDGFKFWGSPVQPWFHDWAFNRQRGPDIKHHWDMIPEGLDVLITHGPPHGLLDKTVRGLLVGCEDLLLAVASKEPRLHVFGHIHEAYGTGKFGNTMMVNASIMNREYEPVNKPVVVDLPAP